MKRRDFIATGLLGTMGAATATGVTACSKPVEKEAQYRIGVCDWMILKRQKLGAFQRTHEIGADGLELDMGGLGSRDTFDNKLLDPVERRNQLAEAFAVRGLAEGARVAVLDRAHDAAAKVADEIDSTAGKALAVACDITDRDAVDAAVAQVTEQFGPIDVLVNNAGWDLFVPFLDTVPDDWARLIDINLVGALNMHHAILPRMVERGSGRVVNISSDAARVGCLGPFGGPDDAPAQRADGR